MGSFKTPSPLSWLQFKWVWCEKQTEAAIVQELICKDIYCHLMVTLKCTCHMLSKYEGQSKKLMCPIMWDAEIVEISNAVYIWQMALVFMVIWFEACVRRRTTAALPYGDPVGKLASLGSPRSYKLLWAWQSLGILRNGLIFLCDNAWLHMAQNLLLQFGWKQEHPPYSLDLAPSHFHLFPALKDP